MSRSYQNIRIKKHAVYTVLELMVLFDVSRNTISNWVKEGLRPSDKAKPYVFNGREVKRFHCAKRVPKKKVPLRIGEFLCLGCSTRGFPIPKSLKLPEVRSGNCGVWGECSSCGGVVTKRVNETDCDRFQKCINTNTSLTSLDEEIEAVEAGIGIEALPPDGGWNFDNDRTIHKWLRNSGQYDSKTVTAHLAAIRSFERFLMGKRFEMLSPDDILDLSRFDAAPLIAFTATKETYYGTETDGRFPPRCGAHRTDQWANA